VHWSPPVGKKTNATSAGGAYARSGARTLSRFGLHLAPTTHRWRIAATIRSRATGTHVPVRVETEAHQGISRVARRIAIVDDVARTFTARLATVTPRLRRGTTLAQLEVRVETVRTRSETSQAPSELREALR